MVISHGEDLALGILGDWSVPRDSDYVPDARRHVRKLAESVLGDGDRAYDVGVCASETIGNAVRHGSGTHIRIFVCADSDGLTVEVTDGGSGSVPHWPEGAAESGRGLMVVSALADRWEYTVDPETGQLSVSFDFDRSPGLVLGDQR